MRAKLTTIVASAALLLAPAAGLAQSADDGPIATAPDAPRNNAAPPPDQPDLPPTAPAAYAPRAAAPAPPEPAAAAQPPPQAYAPQPPAYAAPAPPPPAEAYAPPPTPPAEAAAPPPASYAAPAQPALAAQASGGAVAYAAPAHRPSFLADTASKDALAGALSFAGAAMAINAEMSAGDKLINADAVDDPAPAIAREVAEGYAAQSGAQVADAPAAWDGGGSARYLVRVLTSEWGFTYYPLDWGHYHLTYDAKLELVDIASKHVIAKASCSHRPNQSAEHFTYDDLTGNGGSMLKSQLKAIAGECAAQFKAAVLKS
jgi:hypothetical protein